MTQHGQCAPMWARMIGVSLLCLACFAAPATAQLSRLPASATAPKLLVAPFGRDQAADSLLATSAADAVRQRMLTSHTGDFATITKEAVCKALEESGFSCTQPLEPSQIGQLAHLLNARFMVDGMVFPHGADSVLVLARLLQTVRTNPLAASAAMVADRAKLGSTVGNSLADRLADKFRSFEPITNCRTALDAKDFVKATESANRALRYDRESGGAYLCMAQVLQANGGNADSVQAAYERAHNADSLNTLVGRQLYLIYEAKHDTAQMLHMLHHIMQVDVADNDIRKVAVQVQVQRGHADSAVAILDDALSRNPNQIDLLVVKAIALGAESKFAEAGASMAAAAAIDSAKIDSMFIARALSFYDAANDSASAFTWRKICTVKAPADADCWFKYSTVLYDRHDTTGAMDGIRRFITLQPASGRGQIVLANWFRAAGQTDSSLAYAKAAVAADSSWKPQAAQMYMAAGYTAFQAKEYPHAIDLLGQAQPWSAPANAPTIAYLLGNSQFFIGLAAVQDLQNNPAVKTNSKRPEDIAAACDLLKRGIDNFNGANANVGAGASVDRDHANQILTYINDVVPRLTAIVTRFKCPH